MRLVPLLLPLLLAGCAAPALDADLQARPQSQTLPWGLTGCQYAVAFVPVPAAAVQTYLPEGFRPLALAEFGLPPDPRGDANIGTELWTCEEGAGLNGTVAGMAYASIFTAVAPPEELYDEANTFHFVKWDVLVPDEARRALLAEAGIPAVPGEGAWGRFQANGDQAAFEGAFEMNGSFALRGAALAPADAALRDFRFTEYTMTPHGLAVWNVTARSTASAAGTGTLVMSGMMADVVGATQAQAYYLAGAGEFVDGTIWLPPREP